MNVYVVLGMPFNKIACHVCCVCVTCLMHETVPARTYTHLIYMLHCILTKDIYVDD